MGDYTRLKCGAALALGIAIGWAGAEWSQRLPDGSGRFTLALGADELTVDDLRNGLLQLDAPQRRQLLEDRAAFARFAERRGQRQVLANAALATRLQAEPATQAALHDGALRLLAARYLERAVPATGVAQPAEAEIEAYYRARPAEFAIPDRLPVWQVFIAAPAEDAERRRAARATARAVLESLLSGEASFAEAARSHSDHAPSRANGGYMGLLAPGDLLPEVRAALLAAPQGKAVGPVETAAGFHVVQRGALVPGAMPSIEDVRTRIANLLAERALARRRAEAVAAAAQAHPVRLVAEDVERWRQALLGEFSSQAPAETAQKSVKKS